MSNSAREQSCPRCSSSTLRPCIDGKTPFLRCTRCDGAYFTDEDDLERFIKNKFGEDRARCFVRWLIDSMENADSTRMGQRKCPICPRTMRQHPFGVEPFCFVVLDRCEYHGLWLDKDEIENVLKGVIKASNPPVPR